MSIEVYIDWEGGTHRVGLLRPAARGSTLSFEYHAAWLTQPMAFAIDPTSLPLRPGPQHSPMLFGAIQDCGPDRWGRVLIERAVRQHVLEAKPYRDLDYVLAKFPKPDDTRDIAAGEVLALGMAREAGIRVADHQLIRMRGRGVSVITRFDRNGTQRIPFLSAHSLLGLTPGEAGSYTLLADGIRQSGAEVREDLRELWRRLMFSLLASNYDDHLRNHGFLMHTPGHWSLSPAYDLNPVPVIDRSATPKTPITERQEEPSIAVAIDAAPRFGLRAAEAKEILREVFHVITQWRQSARRLRLSAGTISAYASAFENPLIDEASRLFKA